MLRPTLIIFIFVILGLSQVAASDDEDRSSALEATEMQQCYFVRDYEHGLYLTSNPLPKSLDLAKQKKGAVLKQIGQKLLAETLSPLRFTADPHIDAAGTLEEAGEQQRSWKLWGFGAGCLMGYDHGTLRCPPGKEVVLSNQAKYLVVKKVDRTLAKYFLNGMGNGWDKGFIIGTKTPSQSESTAPRVLTSDYTQPYVSPEDVMREGSVKAAIVERAESLRLSSAEAARVAKALGLTPGRE